MSTTVAALASNQPKRLRIRPWKYIFNSKSDFCELWLSFLFVILGGHIALLDPIDKAWYYEPISNYGIGSHELSFTFLITGGINLIKILFPCKPKIIFDLGIKLLMFFLLVLMTLATTRYSILHVVSIFYGMVSILSASIIARTP